MVASPDVMDATAFYDGSNTIMMALVNNSGTYGWIETQFMRGENESLGGPEDLCLQTKINPWVYKIIFSKSGLIYPIDFVNTSGCSGTSAENCSVTPPTCTDRTLKRHFNTGGITPINVNNTMPSAPTSLVVTPGNTYLNISWNAVPDPSGKSEVFAYNVAINLGTTQILNEYVSKNIKNIIIPDLVNGNTYTVKVSGLSHSNIAGNVSNATGTPGTSAVGSINFSSNPPGAEIFIDGQDQNHITPYTITGVPVGTHSYRLTLANFPDITGNVTVQENTIAEVSVNFTTGQVNVGALVVGVGIVAVLIGGIYYFLLRKPDAIRPGG
jgi:hypothetical protein